MTHRTVTPPDPERTARNLEVTRTRTLEDALAFGCGDPGAFLPRRVTGTKGDRVYEPLINWQARACALIVTDRRAAGVED